MLYTQKDNYLLSNQYKATLVAIIITKVTNNWLLKAHNWLQCSPKYFQNDVQSKTIHTQRNKTKALVRSPYRYLTLPQGTLIFLKVP